jgi:penicillin-binding protein 1A
MLLFAPLALAHRVYLDREGLPELDRILRFEAPTIGKVEDARGEVLIEVAREYRRIVSYDEIPQVVRDAILSAEDKNFFSHSGLDYSALPRVLWKAAQSSLLAWRRGDSGLRLRMPQGGSTLTQQLVRGYFLQDWVRAEQSGVLYRDGFLPRVVSVAVGARTTNKLARKLEEARLAVWLEGEMRRRYGSREEAKRQIFARYANLIYLGNGRYGFAAASQYYFGKDLASYTGEDAGKAALLAGIAKAPGEYAPGDPRSVGRRDAILALMARNGSIPEALAERCRKEPVTVAPRPRPSPIDAPAAVEHVIDELKTRGGGRFSAADLFDGRVSVRSTVDRRVQAVVNDALEKGLARYEKRHPRGKGQIQGSVVVLRNADAAILAEAGSRKVYNGRLNVYSDYNRVTDSARQPGSAMKPLAYLAAFGSGMDLDTTVPDEPIGLPTGGGREVKWIANYDGQFKGPMPLREALAESRNAAAVWVAREAGLYSVIQTARAVGIRSPLQPYLTTALGASEVRLLELADAYRAMASELLAEPHVIDRVTDPAGGVLYEAPRAGHDIRSAGFTSAQLRLIQEGLRGVVRLPGGTAHALAGRDFPIPVMGKTGTTSEYRDALFAGSTYGPSGITVAVRIGYDDDRELGAQETGARTALPVFREIVLRVYEQGLVGAVPSFPPEIEQGIDEYLALRAALAETRAEPLPDPSPNPAAGPGT